MLMPANWFSSDQSSDSSCSGVSSEHGDSSAGVGDATEIGGVATDSDVATVGVSDIVGILGIGGVTMGVEMSNGLASAALFNATLVIGRLGGLLAASSSSSVIGGSIGGSRREEVGGKSGSGGSGAFGRCLSLATRPSRGIKAASGICLRRLGAYG